MSNLGLVQQMSERSNHSQEVLDELMQLLVEAMQESLASGDAFQLDGIGSFSVCTRAARKKKDKQSGAMIEVPACKTVSFRPDSDLRAKLG